MRCPLGGCGAGNPEVVVSGQDHPIALALDQTHLYWVTGWRNGETGGPSSRPVQRCVLPGCAAQTIEPFERATYQPYGITVFGDNVYLSAWPSLASCPKTGCTGAANNIGGGPYVSLDRDDTWLYAAGFGFREVRRCPLTGCNTGTTAVVTNVSPLSVVIDATSVFVADYDFFNFQGGQDAAIRTGRILRCPLAGCDAAGPTVVEAGEISPYALAERGDRLYFTNVGHGTVISRSK